MKFQNAKTKLVPSCFYRGSKIQKLEYLLVTLFFIVTLLFVAPLDAKKKKKIKVLAGVPVQGMSITFDASYDKSLDNLVPGYKILTVAVVNDSFGIIPLNPDLDKWMIKVNNKRKKYRAVTNMREKDPKVWNKLPSGVRKLLAYPLVLPIGARQAVDLLFEDDVDVGDYTSLIIELAGMDKTIILKPRDY